jgi:hypothetical protein
MRRVILLVTVSATMLAMCALPILAQDPTGQAPRGSVCKVKPSKASAKGVDRHLIQAADHKNACATILLASGTYRENVNIDRNVTIRGVEGDERTVVNGGGNGPVFDNSRPVVEGEGDPDIPVEARSPWKASPSRAGSRGCTNCPPRWVGGGIFSAGPITLNESTVRGNTAGSGTGGGIDGYNGGVYLNNSTVSGNTGGGIETYEGHILLNNNSAVRDNTARYGDGIYGQYGKITPNEGSTISGNTAQGDGGVYVFNYASITLLGDSGIENNSPDDVDTNEDY